MAAPVAGLFVAAFRQQLCFLQEWIEFIGQTPHGLSVVFVTNGTLMNRLELRWLILLFIAGAAILIYGTGIHASRRALAEQLTQQSLAANQAYAAKMAIAIDGVFDSARSQLLFSARSLEAGWGSPSQFGREVERLSRQTQVFDAAFIIQADGIVLAAQPSQAAQVGYADHAQALLDANAARRPFTSTPFEYPPGEWGVIVTHPVFDRDGQYRGYVGGAIHLQRRNVLGNLLEQPTEREGTYLYVADQGGQVIFHPMPERLGEIVVGNPMIDAAKAGKQGRHRLTNLYGIDMLGGYAPIRTTGWAIITQQPTEAALQGLDGLTQAILKQSLPVLLPLFVLFGWLSWRVARPLRHLAVIVRRWASPYARDQASRIKTSYREAEQLRQAIEESLVLIHRRLGEIHQESLTDPLTGLANRRGLQIALDQWSARRQFLALVAVEISHLRTINERHGYDMGNQVIQVVSRVLRQVTQGNDVPSRLGGNHFLLLLPDLSLEMAVKTAERLRLLAEFEKNPTGSPIRLVAGVTCWPGGEEPIEDALRLADEALFEAKLEDKGGIVVRKPEI